MTYKEQNLLAWFKMFKVFNYKCMTSEYLIEVIKVKRLLRRHSLPLYHFIYL